MQTERFEKTYGLILVETEYMCKTLYTYWNQPVLVSVFLFLIFLLLFFSEVLRRVWRLIKQTPVASLQITQPQLFKFTCDFTSCHRLQTPICSVVFLQVPDCFFLWPSVSIHLSKLVSSPVD